MDLVVCLYVCMDALNLVGISSDAPLHESRNICHFWVCVFFVCVFDVCVFGYKLLDTMDFVFCHFGDFVISWSDVEIS